MAGAKENTNGTLVLSVSAKPWYLGSEISVAVGTIITDRPPHRTVLALLTHTVPTLEKGTPGPFQDRTHSRRTGVADIVWHGVQHRPNTRESPWPTAFPPCAPPTVPRPCSRTSLVLCSRSTPRRRAWRTYGSSPSPPGPPTSTGGDGVSRFSRMEFLCMPGVFDSAGLRLTRVFVTAQCCLPYGLTPSASRNP